MNFELTDFAQTLAIGGFVLLGIWSVFAMVLGSLQVAMITRLLPDSLRSLQFGSAWYSKVLAIIVVAAVGLLAEDISNKYVDTDDLIEWIEAKFGANRTSPTADCSVKRPGAYLPTLLRPRTEAELRSAALFGEEVSAGKVGELSMSIAHVGGFSSYGGVYGRSVERDLLMLDGLRTADVLGDVPNGYKQPAETAALSCQSRLEWLATRVYYSAKNRVYREPNYFDELSKIQKRIDFTRSIALLSASLLLLLITVVLIKSIIWTVLSSAPYLSHHAWRQWPPRRSSAKACAELERRLRMTWTLRVLLVATLGLAALYGSSLFAYHAEETEFDRRAYGYYSSLAEAAGVAIGTSDVLQGASALLRLPDGSGYIAVTDSKVGDAKRIDLSRLGRLTFLGDGAPRVEPIPTSWMEKSAPPYDLEAACWLIPQETLLVFESGSRPRASQDDGVSASGRRIVSVRLFATDLGYTAKEERFWTMEEDFDEVEGVICKGHEAVGSMILAASRTATPDGDITLARLELSEDGKATMVSLTKLAGVRRGVPGYERLVSDLVLTRDNEIIAVAADDPPGDKGPFKSAIYTLGDLAADGTVKVRVQLRAVIQGFKVEAISPADSTAHDVVVGTDDEAAGSAWRYVRLSPRASPVSN